MLVGGQRYGFDEHRFNPVRALVSAGSRVRFVIVGKVGLHQGTIRPQDMTSDVLTGRGLEAPRQGSAGATGWIRANPVRTWRFRPNFCWPHWSPGERP